MIFINIAIAFSGNWQEFIKVELYALLSTNKAPLNIYLLTDADGEFDTVELFKQLKKNKRITSERGIKIKFINLEKLYNERLSRAVVSGRFTKYTLYRLLLPEVLDCDRLLYLDADTIVNADLLEFYNMELEGALIAGVVDSGADRYNLKRRLGLSRQDPYLNAGVMLFDMKQIREKGIDKQWINLINTTRYPCNDQDVINLTCKGSVKVIGAEYNVSVSTSLWVEENDIKIAHFAGAKPWEFKACPNRDIWRKGEKELLGKKDPDKIPRIIHYGWFGGKKKPDLIKKCIASWQRYMPDYEIIEWNENNFDVNQNKFVRDAYIQKKFAFVTDYLMLDVLYRHGGIYMDADVEVIKPLDRFLEHQCFTGHETPELPITAILGAVPGHPWIKLMRDYYATAEFKLIPNTKIIAKITAPLIEKQLYGFTYLIEEVVIYPQDTFCPFDHRGLKPLPTPNTYAIHHFAGSWKDRNERKVLA